MGDGTSATESGVVTRFSILSEELLSSFDPLFVCFSLLLFGFLRLLQKVLSIDAFLDSMYILGVSFA